jgi:hypothetical protein
VSGIAFWKRRWVHLLFVGGMALAASQVLGAMPRDQVLVFSRPDRPVRELAATFLDAEGESVGGVSLHFPEGRQRRIRHTVNVPNGEYSIHISLEFLSTDGASEEPRTKTNLNRRVTLRGGETPISL